MISSLCSRPSTPSPPRFQASLNSDTSTVWFFLCPPPCDGETLETLERLTPRRLTPTTPEYVKIPIGRTRRQLTPTPLQIPSQRQILLSALSPTPAEPNANAARNANPKLRQQHRIKLQKISGDRSVAQEGPSFRHVLIDGDFIHCGRHPTLAPTPVQC